MSRKHSFFTNVALSIAFSASVLACSDSDDAAPNDGIDAGSDAAHDSDAGVKCVLQSDGTCPEGCVAMKGAPFDEENQCWLEQVTLGCAGPDGAFPDAEGCYVHIDSETLYTTPNIYFDLDKSEYRECIEGELAALAGAGRCNDGQNVDCKLLDDGSCPEGCLPLKGYPYDDEDACRLDEEALDCAKSDGGDDAIGCYVHEETGAKYWTPSLYTEGMAAFRGCTEDEKPDGFDTAEKCE